MTIEEFTKHIEAVGQEVLPYYLSDGFKIEIYPENRKSSEPYLISEEMRYSDDIARTETRSRVCQLLLRRILALGVMKLMEGKSTDT
jgi:hypothetical protein